MHSIDVNGDFGFIVSKPLPLMVCLAIIQQLPKKFAKDLIITNTFYGAEKMADRLSEVAKGRWSVVFLENHSFAYDYCIKRRYSKVFLDSDVGFQIGLKLLKIKILSRGVDFFVYEEGLGAYRSDMYYGLKKIILQMMGFAVYFGDNRLTKKIFVFNPGEYIKSVPNKGVQVIEIVAKIPDILTQFIDDFNYIFEIDQLLPKLAIGSKSECCEIYLTSWVLDDELVNRPPEKDVFRIIKAHPHIRSYVNFENFDMSVEPGLPAELLLLNAIKFFKKVIVIHHGSSVERYIKDNNLSYKNLNQLE